MEGTSRMGSTEEQTLPGMSLSLYNFVEDANDSRSGGSDNYEISDDQEPKDLVAADERSTKRVKYQRHTPDQICELESFFVNFPHPNEHQRLELGNKLGLEARQVKFWFQNRRTQLKIQHERHEKATLQNEYHKLRIEILAMKEAMENTLCKECGEFSLGEQPLNSQELRLENERLKKEILHVCGILQNFMAKPSSEIVNSFSQLSLSLCGSNSSGRSTSSSSSSSFGVVSSEYQKNVYHHIAAAAMHELILLAKKDSTFWIKSLDGEREMLNHEEYAKWFNHFGANPSGFVSEATRATGSVVCTKLDLIDTLMHPIRWAEMFPCMIGKVSVIEVLCSGVAGTPDGELLMMNAELVFPSPLVPLRQIRFLRYCKKHSDSMWAVADISIDPIREDYQDVAKRCRKLPSGCLVEELPNGNSMVTFVEHDEYDESLVHSLLRPLMRSGVCYGAERWLATLQRQSECYAFLATCRLSTRRLSPPDFPIGITIEGRLSIVKLMKRVVDSFCYGICASTLQKWNKIPLENITPETRVMTRVNVTDPGELSGIILSAATCVWLPITRQRIFNFLRDPRFRAQWDLLSGDGPMRERIQIKKSPAFSDCISLLVPPPNPNRLVKTLVLQQTWADKVSSAVIFTAAEIATITAVMGGEDSSSVKLLPSGFVIVDRVLEAEGAEPRNGSLMTLGFQILINSTPTTMVTEESIETVNVVMNQTIRKIKAALD